MRHIQSFNQFILTEANTGERVAIFPGRFMPVHEGHITAFKNAYNTFKIRIIPIQIVKPGPDSPFPLELLQEIGSAVQMEYSTFLADWIMYPQSLKTVIPQMAKVTMESGFNPVALGCGADRLKDYQRQVDYLLSPKSDVKVNEFTVETVMNRDEDGPSGTRVREVLKSGTEKDFQKMVPKSVGPFYTELKKYIK